MRWIDSVRGFRVVLTIVFIPNIENPEIDGIEILPAGK
jgi:hypothetical protein